MNSSRGESSFYASSGLPPHFASSSLSSSSSSSSSHSQYSHHSQHQMQPQPLNVSNASASNRRFESPNRARIAQLANKLSGLQSNLEDDKQHRVEAIEARLRTTDDRINALLSTQDKRLLQIRDAVSQAERALDEERRAREVLSEAKGRDVAATDLRLQSELDGLVKVRKESENRVLAILDDKIRSLVMEFSASNSSSSSNSGHHHSHHSHHGATTLFGGVALDASRIREAVAMEKSAREDAENKLIQTISAELAELAELAEQERRTRERAEDALVRMLQDAGNRLVSELDAEKRDRQETEETLLALLEDTCVKINEANAF
eukprot:ANDGO_02939.mRNA.1 IQ calmodulin-binding motif protein